MNSMRVLGALGGSAALIAGVVVVGASSASGAPNPISGNNGTIKIDNIPVDDTTPDNQPHVGCTFGVDFYDYDQGDYFADVEFAVQPPTGSPQTVLTDSVFVGEDPAGGGTDLDASVTYTLDLAGFEAHPQQGHHVKLTVNSPYSKGATVKHKVFWVTGCESPTPTPTPTS